MNNKILLTVPDFEPSLAKNYELCIEIGQNDYSYAIINPEDQTVKVLCHKPSIIHNDISGSLLQSHFSKTKISLLTQKFTFIPSAIYHQKDLINYSTYIKASENEDILTKTLDKAGITIIYALPKLQLDKISADFPDAHIFPQISPFYNGVAYGFSQIGFSQLFINFKPGLVEVIIINQHQFHFYNIFEFQNDDELLYFLLLAVKENKVKPASVTVKISGNITTKSSAYERVLAQFPRTEVTDQDSLPLFYQGLNQPVMPRFFSLLSLYLCE